MNKNLFDDLVVVKRSGQRVSFNGPKIALAIKKAFDSVQNESNEKDINKVFENVLNNININYEDRKTINVEDVQDIIENELKNLKFNEVYESFTKYRERRAISRELCAEKEEHKFSKSIEKLNEMCSLIDDEKPIKLLLNMGKTILEDYTAAYLLDTKYQRAHEEGKIYIHDKGLYPFGLISSCHLDLSNIKKEYSYSLLSLSKCLKDLSNEIYKELSIPSIDYILEDYIINDFKKIYIKYLKKYMELNGIKEYINFSGLEEEIRRMHSININEEILNKYILNEEIKRVFNKSHKDSLEDLKERFYEELTIFLKEIDSYKVLYNEYTISFGTNNSYEGTIINNLLLKLIGENKYENINFIFKIKKNINHDLYLEVLKEISNNKKISVSFVDNETRENSLISNDYKHEIEHFNDGVRIYDNIYEDKRQSIGRMILGEISINLSLIALNTKGINCFYVSLGETLELVKNALLNIFEIKANKNNCEVSLNNKVLIDSEKLEEGQRIRKILKKGSFSIKIVGLKECIYSLKEIKDKKDLKLVYDILNYIRKKCDEYTKELKLNFILSEETEIKVYKFFHSIDKSIHGNILNVTDKNSYEKFYKIYENMNMSLEEYLESSSKISNIMNGGYTVNILLNKKINYKELDKYIKLVETYDIDFIKFKFNKKEDSV